MGIGIANRLIANEAAHESAAKIPTGGVARINSCRWQHYIPLASHPISPLVRHVDIAKVRTVLETTDVNFRRTLMVRAELSKASIGRLALRLAMGAGAVLLVSGTFALVAPGQAQATPAYAQATGKPCGFCHVSPGGGGPLKAAGKKFKANGHKL